MLPNIFNFRAYKNYIMIRYSMPYLRSCGKEVRYTKYVQKYLQRSERGQKCSATQAI